MPFSSLLLIGGRVGLSDVQESRRPFSGVIGQYATGGTGFPGRVGGRKCARTGTGYPSSIEGANNWLRVMRTPKTTVLGTRGRRSPPGRQRSRGSAVRQPRERGLSGPHCSVRGSRLAGRRLRAVATLAGAPARGRAVGVRERQFVVDRPPRTPSRTARRVCPGRVTVSRSAQQWRQSPR